MAEARGVDCVNQKVYNTPYQMTARTDRSDPKSLFPCIRDGAKRIVQAKVKAKAKG